MLVASLATVGLAAWAPFEPALARSAYLRLALFHGPVELAVVRRVEELAVEPVPLRDPRGPVVPRPARQPMPNRNRKN